MALRLTKKVMDSVVGEVAGLDVVPLVHALKGRENVSEFILAEEIGQEINTTRNMLYRLQAANLVTFTRKKDKKKGWYIYYWTFNQTMIRILWKSVKTRQKERLANRLKRERTNQFYSAGQGSIRLSFEQAMDYDFRCPETGDILQPEDNTKLIKTLEKEIKDLEKQIKQLKV